MNEHPIPLSFTTPALSWPDFVELLEELAMHAEESSGKTKILGENSSNSEERRADGC